MRMAKIISAARAAELVGNGATVMISGFMGVKSPEAVIGAIIAKGAVNLTVIANDAAVPGIGVGRLVTGKHIGRLIVSHVGLNPEAGAFINAGEILADIIPQGTLAERIRCGGAGIGGFLTQTGVGTSVEEGKTKLDVGGITYLLELPLHADVALLKGSVVDRTGNVYYKGTTKNFSTVMAMAADTVIVEAEQLVEPGAMDPDMVMTPGIFVDYIVAGGEAQ
jgi:acetate CoA/acetoacetate CoA-transferase alpha subunit